jgi:hypothetical protein
MEQTMPFCLDHFSIITDKRRQASELLKGLGFVTSDTHKNGSTHFIFDNTYCEVFYTERGGQLKWLTNTIPAGAMPRVGSYRLSVGGQDAGRVREALLSGNVEGVGEVNPVFRQPVRYGEVSGEAGYQTIFIIGQQPFTDVLFGATTHMNKDLIVALPSKFRHVNGAKRISSLTFFCEDQATWNQAVSNVDKVYHAMEPVTDHVHCLNMVRLLDKSAYEAEFGVPCPESGHFPAVAASFSDCVLHYVEEQADDWGLRHFQKNGALYVDTRADLGIFLIFEP